MQKTIVKRENCEVNFDSTRINGNSHYAMLYHVRNGKRYFMCLIDSELLRVILKDDDPIFIGQECVDDARDTVLGYLQEHDNILFYKIE